MPTDAAFFDFGAEIVIPCIRHQQVAGSSPAGGSSLKSVA
jgi:hypothetical protein